MARDRHDAERNLNDKGYAKSSQCNATSKAPVQSHDPNVIALLRRVTPTKTERI